MATPPQLISPLPDARLPGIADFAWKPTTPLVNGMAYEVVVWSPEQDPNQAWGIAPPTQDTRLEVNLDELFEGGRFREGSLYWTVVIAQKDPYLRVTLPGDGERRYLVYTASD